MKHEEASPEEAAVNHEVWSLAAQWGAESRMNELETFMWRSERHPVRSSTICSLAMLEEEPDWERLYAAHQWATELIPRMSERVLEPTVPVGPAAWVADPAFDLDYHLRRAQLRAPGTTAQLLEFVQGEAMRPFDRTRPLWEGTLIEGLEHGKAAYLLKLHHSLTDGLGGIQLMALVQSRTPKHTPKKPVDHSHRTPPEPDPNRLAVDEATEQARAVPQVARKLLATGLQGLSSPGTSVSSTLRFTGSLRRMLSPPPTGGSPLWRERTGRVWRFGALECEFARLRAAAKATSASVNDAYVAALLGGIRRYHEDHDVELDKLPMAMPLSVRKSDDPMGGNKFAGAMFAAPVSIEDPAERIATIRGIVLSVRVEPALDTLSLITPVVNRLPSGVGATAAQISSAADLSASNVPGLPYATYMAGAKVEKVIPFGPLPGVAVMAAMVTHNGTCCIGLNMDGSVIGDPEHLIACMHAGFDEVLALAD